MPTHSRLVKLHAIRGPWSPGKPVEPVDGPAPTPEEALNGGYDIVARHIDVLPPYNVIIATPSRRGLAHASYYLAQIER